MLNLNFQVASVEAVPFAVGPQLLFKLRIDEAVNNGKPWTPIHAIALRCQIRIEPARRRYEQSEQSQLLDLFGTPERWGQTLRTMLWTHTSSIVRPFTGTTVAELPVPCSYDFNVAANKFFYALEDGEVPLSFLFSGTIFYEAVDGALQVTQLSWDKEAAYRLPVRVWKEMMELYYPNSAWLCLRKDVFDRLSQYKSRRAIPTWEQALESLLPLEDAREGP